MKLSAVEEFLTSKGFPPYRFRQIRKNYLAGRYRSFSDMTDLPLALRQELNSNFSLYSANNIKVSTSGQSQKALLSLADGLQIETVLMNYDHWLTACLSTQVGCSLGCLFCATGKMGFKRNLTAEEIIDQILFWKNYISPLSKGEAPAKTGEKDLTVSRIVFMGMGEPFLNWDNLISALKIINDPDNLNIGSRKISISTAGIIPKIIEFADLNTEINLAISLHSLNPKNREHLMPITKQYPLPTLLQSCQYYTSHTRRQLFFEYALIGGVNDSPGDLNLLIGLLKSNRLYYLNLICLNPTTKSSLKPSSPRIQEQFIRRLTYSGVNFSLRHSFGANISAACGQLAASN